MSNIRVLITNDDGIMAPGIRSLAVEISRIAKVTVIAPDRERSAVGHAITVHYPLRAERVDFNGGIEAFAVNGTPSDCVKLGVESILEEPPALVISGINRGANLGTDIIYSGTVSAAVEGTILGIASIAVSLTSFNSRNYELAAQFARILTGEVLERGLPSDTLLNVNVPPVDSSELKGVRVTRLGIRKYRDVIDKRVDPRGRAYYWLAGEAVDVDDDPETDTVAIKQNFISVTPVHFDLTNYGLLSMLKSWNLDEAQFDANGEPPER